MFRPINTAMVEYPKERYVALSEVVVATATVTVAAAGISTGRAFQYRDFDNMKPPTFDRAQGPIIAMRWLSDIQGCFFTCSCLTDQKASVL